LRPEQVWRPAEGRKDAAKQFTIGFIVIGIGILGVLVGEIGDKVLDWVEHGLHRTEQLMDIGTSAAVGAVGAAAKMASLNVDSIDSLVHRVPGHTKQLLVAFVGTTLVFSFGTLAYGPMESMKVIDAACHEMT